LLRVVSANYFRTLGIPIKLGRDFSALDTPKSEKVIILNEKLAAKLWPKQDPIGRHLLLDRNAKPQDG
jgi:hypothetical protein